ncbi:MAG TPA: guanylate kinase [Gemmatimonadales bacterium]|nr:guanylate kinase [Gemmatimonadales bacterium]
MTPRVVVLSAPSGGGKTTITRALLGRRADVGYSVSATTRQPRPGERDGAAYHFLRRAQFEQRRAAGEFLEWAEYAGELYGTLRAEVEQVLRSGRHVLMDIDVQGVRQVRPVYPPPASLSVFLVPPAADVLIERLRGRNTESGAEVARRLAIAAAETAEALQAVARAAEPAPPREPPLFDAVVVNDDLERAVAQVSALIDAPPVAAHPSAELVARLRQLIAGCARAAEQLNQRPR